MSAGNVCATLCGVVADTSKCILSREQKERIWACAWLTDRERLIFDLFYRRDWRIEDIVAVLADETDNTTKKKTYSRSTVERELRRLRGYGGE